MLGYRHYADDVLEYFVQKSVANGIDIIRIFDALNDIRNLETAVKAAKKEGAHAQIATHSVKYLQNNITSTTQRELKKQALILSASRIWRLCLLLMKQKDL